MNPVKRRVLNQRPGDVRVFWLVLLLVMGCAPSTVEVDSTRHRIIITESPKSSVLMQVGVCSFLSLVFLFIAIQALRIERSDKLTLRQRFALPLFSLSLSVVTGYFAYRMAQYSIVEVDQATQLITCRNTQAVVFNTVTSAPLSEVTKITIGVGKASNFVVLTKAGELCRIRGENLTPVLANHIRMALKDILPDSVIENEEPIQKPIDLSRKTTKLRHSSDGHLTAE